MSDYVRTHDGAEHAPRRPFRPFRPLIIAGNGPYLVPNTLLLMLDHFCPFLQCLSPGSRKEGRPEWPFLSLCELVVVFSVHSSFLAGSIRQVRSSIDLSQGEEMKAMGPVKDQ